MSADSVKQRNHDPKRLDRGELFRIDCLVDYSRAIIKPNDPLRAGYNDMLQQVARNHNMA